LLVVGAFNRSESGRGTKRCSSGIIGVEIDGQEMFAAYLCELLGSTAASYNVKAPAMATPNPPANG
jgi:hypothetical protein